MLELNDDGLTSSIFTTVAVALKALADNQ